MKKTQLKYVLSLTLFWNAAFAGALNLTWDNGNLLPQLQQAVQDAPKPAAPAPAPVPVPRDVRWVTHSREYAVLCQQAFSQAYAAVRKAAVARGGVHRRRRLNVPAQPFAVVMDADETVLDNSTYQKERAALNLGYTKDSWKAWVKRREAGPVPGAVEFIAKLRKLGKHVHVAYLTNREVDEEADTVENLKKLALFADGDIILARKDKADTKEIRRQCIESGTGRCAAHGRLPILALLGDQLTDFVELSDAEIAKLDRAAFAKDKNWGKKWFLLPNPMYGNFEKIP